MIETERVQKNLTRMTTFRLSEDQRQKAEECASSLGMSFSDFLRQSIEYKIHVSGHLGMGVNIQSLEMDIES